MAHAWQVLQPHASAYVEENLFKHLSNDRALDHTKSLCCKSVACPCAAVACSDAREAIWS
jgi:hypothetical protein